MDFLFLLQAIVSLLAISLLIYKQSKFLITNKKGKENSAPGPCGGWPLIGHHLLLKNQIPAHQTLASIADEYGPIFSIRLGTRRALVVSSSEAVKECFKTNDRIFLNRPASAASRYMGYNNAMFGLAPYGPYWRDIRKIAILKVLSNTRLLLLKHARASEVETGIRNLYSLCRREKTGLTVVDMGQWFASVTLNMVVRTVAGTRLTEDEESQRFIKAISKFMHLLGVSAISDAIPFTEWLDFQGHVKSMKSTAMELDYFMSKWLEEHLQSWKDEQVTEERDFIDALLSSVEDQNSLDEHKKENVVKATALNLIIAGTDTTSLTLTWALSLLLNHPKVLERAQEELDNNVGKERWVEESDFKNLPLLQAIIKETMRLYPAGPLSLPREAMEDCYIGGFHVRKGTILLVNVYKLHHDPRIWPNPCEFQPERFLGSNIELDDRSQQFYIPFSSGRRSCPGISSAMQMNHLMLARVLQGFNLSTPMNAPVDMSEASGISLVKSAPLEAIITPRLQSNLY